MQTNSAATVMPVRLMEKQVATIWLLGTSADCV